MTFIRLNRHVAREHSACHRCAYPIAVYSSAYEPTIGGVALARFCSERCASYTTRAELRVSYE